MSFLLVLILKIVDADLVSSEYMLQLKQPAVLISFLLKNRSLLPYLLVVLDY